MHRAGAGVECRASPAQGNRVNGGSGFPRVRGSGRRGVSRRRRPCPSLPADRCSATARPCKTRGRRRSTPARAPAPPALRHPRQGGRSGRDRAPGQAAAWLPAPLPAPSLRHPQPSMAKGHRPDPRSGRGQRPRRGTLGAVLAALDPALLEACFTAWVEGLRAAEPDLIAIDGRPRGAATPARKATSLCTCSRPLRRLGAGCCADGSAAGRWASRQWLVLGQEAVTGKPNEILAIPLLLERLRLLWAERAGVPKFWGR